jgi:hypothetical protein
MRVYAPATRADLDRLRREASWRPSAPAFAVTEALRGWVRADGPADDEELELAAMSEAARQALRLLGPDVEPADAQRVVVALDLPPTQVSADDDGPEDPPGRVRLTAEAVPVGRVASVHIDEPSAAKAVVAAAAALAAADDGDLAAEAVVAALDDHDLLWYDAAELPGITGDAPAG